MKARFEMLRNPLSLLDLATHASTALIAS